MDRTYTLTAQFNTVTFTIDDAEIIGVLDLQEECSYNEEGELIPHVPDEELIKRVLKREFDILSSIKLPAVKKPAAEKPSEKQIAWAEDLGMKNAKEATKKEVWAFIQEHKKTIKTEN